MGRGLPCATTSTFDAALAPCRWAALLSDPLPAEAADELRAAAACEVAWDPKGLLGTLQLCSCARRPKKFFATR